MSWYLVRPDALTVLKDEKVLRSLNRYFKVFRDKLPAKFLIAKRIEAVFDESDSLDRLWALHDKLTVEYYRVESKIDKGDISLEDLGEPKRSYLDLKVEIAKRLLKSCIFCERKCRVNRLEGKLGYCKCGYMFLLSSAFHHLGEEPELVPSGTIFSLGCNLTCLHCQNWTISQYMEPGEPITSEELAEIVTRLRREGCRNCNMVGGSPTPWLHAWLEAFKYVKLNVPTVWNSNSYYSVETAKLLKGFIDVYLLDYKYGRDECAVRISNAPNYVEVCSRNHLIASESGELIIRVLLLPNHIECCGKPILKWIRDNLGEYVRVNIMDQYRPHWRANEVPELRRRLTHEEYNEALEYAKSIGLSNLA